MRSLAVSRMTIGDVVASSTEGTPSSAALAITAPQAGPKPRNKGSSASPIGGINAM